MKLLDELHTDGVKQLWQRREEWWPATEIDLSAVHSLDSAGLALMVKWALAVQQRGQVATLIGVPEKFSTLAELYGVSSLFVMES